MGSPRRWRCGTTASAGSAYAAAAEPIKGGSTAGRAAAPPRSPDGGPGETLRHSCAVSGSPSPQRRRACATVLASNARHPHEPAHGTRHLRPDRGTGGTAVGCPDAALAAELRDFRRAAAAGDHPCAGAGQARVGGGQPRAGLAGRAQVRGDRRGGRRGAGRSPRSRIPAGGLANRLRDPDQHERQRGAGQPGQRVAGRAARRGPAGAPERRRQPQPVVQRRVPDRHAPGGGGSPAQPVAAGPGPAAGHPAAQERRTLPASSRSAAPTCRTRRR